MDSVPAYSSRDQHVSLIIIALAVLMASLDSTIVNISLPGIAKSFDADLGMVSWVVISYLLALAGFLLILGKLADLRGFKKVFIAGFGIFTLFSLLCGLSGSIHELIAFRALQGIGGAALEALAPAMIVLYFPRAVRGKMLGILATVVSLGIAAGPILGGFITQYISWHWIFFINVPIGIIAIIAAFGYLPKDSTVSHEQGFDYAGSVLIIGALVFLLYPLNQGLELGWTSPVIIGSIVISAICWILFYIQEKRSIHPLVDLKLFSSGKFVMGNIASMILMMVDCGTVFLLPFFFEIVQEIPVSHAGILLAIPAVAVMAVGVVSGSLADRYGTRILTTASALLAACALFLLSGYTADTRLPYIIVSLVVLGIAFGLFFPPNMSRILREGCSESDQSGHGVASSVMMTIRNIGAVLGVAVFGTVAVLVMILSLGPGADTLTPALLVTGMSAAFTCGAVLCCAAAVLSFALGPDTSCQGQS